MKHGDILSELIDNPMRARLIRIFVGAEGEYAASLLMKRLGISRVKLGNELKALSRLGIVKRVPATLPRADKVKTSRGSTEEYWMLDRSSHVARALASFVHEVSPVQFDDVERAIKGTGRVTTVILSGVFMGDPSRPADLLIAGDALNERRLERVVRELEPRYGREIRYATFSTPEFRYRLTVQDRLLRDILDFPHRVLLNKERLFS